MTTTISGTHIGSPGLYNVPAGAGLKLTSHTANYTLTSSAIAVGGAGFGIPQFAAYTGSGIGLAGGIGVDLSTGGHLTNAGDILGGYGGRGANGAYGDSAGGAGGIGVQFAGSGTLMNHGEITGGLGGHNGYGRNAAGGAGGTGVHFTGNGLVINDSQITGGGGGYGGAAGGDGVDFAANSTLANHGVIAGGNGSYGYSPAGQGDGGIGVELAAGGLVTNSGVIIGGDGGEVSYYTNVDTSSGGFISARGGSGIDLAKGGIVLNTGTISGGTGGGALTEAAYGVFAGRGGDGIDAASGGVVINAGSITGGMAGSEGFGPYPSNSYGGNGVSLSTGPLVNFGRISGGKGGFNGGSGGNGADLAAGAIPDVNFGTIAGGNSSTNFIGRDRGGIGVDLTGKGSFINFGTIAGGSSQTTFYGNYYSTGIYLGGGSTLFDAGRIASGGYSGNAVSFGGAGSSHLILTPDASFYGIVTAAGSKNLLELTSGKFGTLSAVGYEFQGFQTIQVDPHASWTIDGTIANMIDNGTVEINSGLSLDITRAVNPASTGIFELTGKASLEIAALLGSHAKIEFLGGTPQNLLTIDDPEKFGLHVGTPAYAGPLLEDFKAGNTIDLKDIGSSGLKFKYSPTTGDLQITASGGGVVASLQFQNASLGAGSFHLATDNAGGSLLTHS